MAPGTPSRAGPRAGSRPRGCRDAAPRSRGAPRAAGHRPSAAGPAAARSAACAPSRARGLRAPRHRSWPAPSRCSAARRTGGRPPWPGAARSNRRRRRCRQPRPRPRHPAARQPPPAVRSSPTCRAGGPASRLEPTEPPAAVLALLLVCGQGRGEVAHAPDRVRHVAALVAAVPERRGPVVDREPVLQERDGPVGIMTVAGPHRAVRRRGARRVVALRVARVAAGPDPARRAGRRVGCGRARRTRSRIVAGSTTLGIVHDAGETRDLEARRHVKAGGARGEHLVTLHPRLGEVELAGAGARRPRRTAQPAGSRSEREEDDESRCWRSHAATRCDVSVSVSSVAACSPAGTPSAGAQRPAQGTGFWITLGSIFSTLVLSSGLHLDSKITFPRSL